MTDIPRRKTVSTQRTSITVPKELLERMRKHPDINWSGVASEAFKEVLTRLKGKT